MSVTYYVEGTGYNPNEYDELQSLLNKLKSNNIPVPKELTEKLANMGESTLFYISEDIRDSKFEKGIKMDAEGSIIIDLEQFKGVRYIKFGCN